MMELHCQTRSSLSRTSLTGFNPQDSIGPLATWKKEFHGLRDRWKNLLRESETKLISSDDNSKVAFNVETDVLLISALFSASKLLLTEQLIDWVGSSCTLIVSVKILKLVNKRKIASKMQIMKEISPINHNIKGKFYFIAILCDGIVIISGINAKHSNIKYMVYSISYTTV